jgi:hypothetical protein
MPHPIDDSIITVAQAFAAELQKIRELRQGRDNYQEDVLFLRVSVGEKGGMSIEHTHGYGNSIRAADFGTLLDEIYRRAGFDEREAGRLQAASATLLPITDKAVETISEARYQEGLAGTAE